MHFRTYGITRGFCIMFCALNHVDYARWFPINNRHEYILTGIQKILSTLLGAA